MARVVQAREGGAGARRSGCRAACGPPGAPAYTCGWTGVESADVLLTYTYNAWYGRYNIYTSNILDVYCIACTMTHDHGMVTSTVTDLQTLPGGADTVRGS